MTIMMVSVDRKVHLKVKIKSLAEEAKIIRREESKLKRWSKHPKAHVEDAATFRWTWRSLADHRRTSVRTEARHALLAYCCLRGTPYRKVEEKVHPGCEPCWSDVISQVHRFGSMGLPEARAKVEAWREASL